MLCGYINGKIAAFCLVEDMGEHTIDGKAVRIGGPGCVGTLPRYRNRGIGLMMVKMATQILKDEGYAYSYIHYTGVGPWYRKLGYETLLTWTKKRNSMKKAMHFQMPDPMARAKNASLFSRPALKFSRIRAII